MKNVKFLKKERTLFLLGIFLLAIVFNTDMYAQTREISGTVTNAANETLVGANIYVKGSTIGTVTDEKGRFTLEIPQDGATLVVSFIGYETKELVVTNETVINVSLTESVNVLSQLTVVGTRNSKRTALNTTVPVDVIEMKDLAVSIPQTDMNQVLNFVVPSFNSTRQSASDGSEHIDPASLRGLGPDQVLVLINGKRRHTTSLVNNAQTVGNGSVGTDLNTIPVSAIERIEVLRDGAAAQYGSDAIAGVINIVLKSATEKISSSLTMGAYSEGDGQLLQYNMNYGFKIGETGFFNVTGEYIKRGETNRTQNHNLIIFDQSAQGNYFAYDWNPGAREIDNGILAAQGLNRDDFNFRIGDAAIENGTVFFNASIPLNKNVELYSFGGISYRDGRGSGFRRLPSDYGNTVYSIFPIGFQPETQSNILDKSIAVGVKGLLKGWAVDFSNTFGGNSFSYIINNTVNASLGGISPTSFEAGGHAFNQNVTNFDFSRYFKEPFKAALKGINVAFGGEFRLDNYQIFAGEEASYKNYGVVSQVNQGQIIYADTLGMSGGSQSFPGFSPENEVDKYRSNAAFYTDFEIDITEKILVTAAGRFENYSDFGSTMNGKVSARFGVTDWLVFRGAASTGFRAPSLHQSYFNTVTIDLVDGNLVETGIFKNDSRIAQYIGIPKLEEETSISYSAGFSARPFENMTVTVDAYQIDVDDRIVLTGAFGNDPWGDPVPELVSLFQEVGATSGRFFTNAVDTRTQGIDIVATYKLLIGKSKLDFALAANFTETVVSDQLNIPANLAGQEDIYFGPQEKSLIETNNPKTKLNFSINYSIGKFSAMLRNVYFGEVTRNGFPYGDEQVFAGKIVTDLSLSYKIIDPLLFSIGGNNILNVLPDEQIYENSYFGVFKYAPVQHGFNGAFFFTRLSFEF
ncbi:MAG: TonB-dependent receptor [Bacteroidota bacterium]